MAQTVSIAPGTAAANGAADIVVPANETWHLMIYTDHPDGFQALLPEQSIVVLLDTPSSADTIIATLSRKNPAISVKGKITLRTKRLAQPAGSANIGVAYNDQV